MVEKKKSLWKRIPWSLKILVVLLIIFIILTLLGSIGGYLFPLVVVSVIWVFIEGIRLLIKREKVLGWINLILSVLLALFFIFLAGVE